MIEICRFTYRANTWHPTVAILEGFLGRITDIQGQSPFPAQVLMVGRRDFREKLMPWLEEVSFI